MGKPIDIELSTQQRAELERLLRVGTTPVRIQTRARILLLSDRSQGGEWRSAPAIARQLLVHANTVRSVRRRFVAAGLEGALAERPRPGAKPKLTGEVEAQLTLLACSEPPAGHARWTLRLLADRLVALGAVEDVSHVTVGEWLKKRPQAVAGEALVHRQAFGAVCGQDGRRAGRLPAATRSGPARDLPGRGR